MRILVFAALLGSLYGQAPQQQSQPPETPLAQSTQAQTPQVQTQIERAMVQLRIRAQAMQKDSQQNAGETGQSYKVAPNGVVVVTPKMTVQAASSNCAIPLLNVEPAAKFTGDPKMPLLSPKWEGDPQSVIATMPVCGKP